MDDRRGAGAGALTVLPAPREATAVRRRFSVFMAASGRTRGLATAREDEAGQPR
jgi:hypothetical protein